MGLEQFFSQQYRECPDKYAAPTTNYQMTTNDYVVRPAPAPAGTLTVTLPPVAEAKGRWYSIMARTLASGATIVVADKDDSEGWCGDITLDSATDRVLAYSDGLAWICFFGNNNACS